MAIDFQLLEAHDVDIESFSYDVSDMVDSIYIGPQGELLEKIELFNHSYNAKIGVTKNFTLKPGCYDEIKKAHARWVLRYDMKPRGLNSIFDRMHQYGWRAQGFKNTVLDIETRMKGLKASGMRWQDNTDQFEEEFDKLKTSIISSLNQSREMYPNVSVECKIIPVSEGRMGDHRRRHYYSDRNNFPNTMFSNDPKDFLVVFYIKLHSIDMMVHVMDDSEVITEYRLPMEDLIVISGTYLLPLISRNWGRTTPLTGNPPNTYSYFLECLYLSRLGKSIHPYVGNSYDKYAWDLNAKAVSGNICTGNMASDIRNSLLNNEILAHVTNIVTWLTNYYVPQTHPLNRINRVMKFGDSIKFAQWRSDLNTTSTRVFQSLNEELPDSCSFSSHVYDSMTKYAINDMNGHYYGADPERFSFSSTEYRLRLHEYINGIEVEDMPCNNCTYQSDCEQWKVIQLVFSESELTPEEEGCLGMLYEYFNYIVNIRNRHDDHAYFEIYYSEMSVAEGWRYRLDRDYHRMMLSHRMCVWWAYTNSESFTPSTSRYRRRMRAFDSITIEAHIHLYENHYSNVESKMSWTLDSIKGYKIPAKNESLTERYERRQQEIANTNQANDQAIDTLLDAVDEDIAIVEESMTPEQRAIQWAIQNGGAQNL